MPKINNNSINIGNFSLPNECKGIEQINFLKQEILNYKDYKINYYIVNVNIPSYNEEEFFDLVKKHHIHGLLHLNKWGESWCYSLTKSIQSGIPIYYNNIGSFKERIPKNENMYIKNIDSENDFYNFIVLHFKK
jgi:hypothetical protein